MKIKICNIFGAITLFSCLSFANTNPLLKEKDFANLQLVLKPQVVSAIYEAYLAELEKNKKLPEKNNLAAAAVAGAAGGAAAKAVEMLVDWLAGDKDRQVKWENL